MTQPFSSFKVDQWRRDVLNAGCRINSITTLNTIMKKTGEHLFSLLDVDVEAPEGYRLPHIVFIRGHATVIVPLLINSENNEERFLMVRQRRIGNGLQCLEFPAGMFDLPEDDPADVAVRELFEETGLSVPREQLFPLAAHPLYSSAGASDETIIYFGCIHRCPSDEFNSFFRKTGGISDENEHIAIELLTRAEAEHQVTSLQARLGFYLFEEHSKSSRSVLSS